MQRKTEKDEVALLRRELRKAARESKAKGTDGIGYSLLYDEQTQEWFCEPKNTADYRSPFPRTFNT